ncbi:energy-coupling factor ABC transporter ATP-binding protein [Kyrpidia spormannii]|uniref:ABC transporter ATP-binding protein n=1 Tax=Kyrpidia spormannii TaxID=2055160 RepID=A0A6F9E543_9BACL|nr:ATP-binding cassette domain-containing protein [Kyrpidia spormannii]CAB3391545.1 energizing coupling factor of ABC influx transporter (ATP-binding protein) [Kyrpidia spormannii]
MDKPTFALEGVEYNYEDGTQALQGISLGIESGKKVAFLGSNGAGKSTLFLHLNGILRPFRGRILFRGQEVRYARKELARLRAKVGIVFQNPDRQVVIGHVWEDVSFGPMNLGLSPPEVEARVEEALNITGLWDLRDKAVHLLSYGQKKRVALAGVLAMKPEVMILDEPTASLDPGQVHALLELLERLHRQGIQIVLSTHDVDFAYAWADWVVIMHAGRVLAEGLPKDVFSDTDILKRASLTKPVLWRVWEELNKAGLYDGGPPRTVEELSAPIARAAADRRPTFG